MRPASGVGVTGAGTVPLNAGQLDDVFKEPFRVQPADAAGDGAEF